MFISRVSSEGRRWAIIHFRKDNFNDTKVGDLLDNGWTLLSPERKAARIKYGERERKKRHREREFVFLIKDFFSKAKGGLTLGEMGLLLFLARYMRFSEEGRLIYKSKRLSVSELAKLVKKSPSQVRRLLAELERRSLLFRIREGNNVYVELSEKMFVCGSLDGKDVKTVKIFKKMLGEVAKNLSLNELGFLMLILESMHWRSHLLCSNPEEKDVNKLKLLHKKDLSDKLGVSKDFAYRTLRKLQELGVIAEVQAIKASICLHPQIVSRQHVNPNWEEICHCIESAQSEKYSKHDSEPA